MPGVPPSQVDRHPNLRLAYVAQHAFHHLEESLDISPVRYILRRYLGGEDKEESQKVHRTYTEEEWEKVRKQVGGGGMPCCYNPGLSPWACQCVITDLFDCVFVFTDWLKCPCHNSMCDLSGVDYRQAEPHFGQDCGPPEEAKKLRVRGKA